MSFPTSLDYPQTYIPNIKPTPVGFKSGRTGSTSSSSSTSSSASFTDFNAYEKFGHLLPPPPSLLSIGRPPSRGSGNQRPTNPSLPSGRVRPAPINTAKANENSSYSPRNAPAPSPRAAIVASLRSATDRRHLQREQQMREQQLQQQQLLLQEQHLQQQKQLQFQQQQQQQSLLLQQQMRMQNLSLNQTQNATPTSSFFSLESPIGPAFHLSPPTSPLPGNSPTFFSSSSTNGPFSPVTDRMDPRMLASLQQKHQELMATSALIAQQQQSIQNAMTLAALGYNVNNAYADGSVDFPPSSPVLGSPLTATPQQQYARNPVYNMDLPAPPGHGNYYRPSSPTLPVRPSSSSSYRPQNSSPMGTYTSQTNQQISSPPSSFRRSHRKAASLSGSAAPVINPPSPTPMSNSLSSQGSGSLGAIGSGLGSNQGGNSLLRNSTLTVVSGSRVGGGDYEIPVRQPIGPPPLDELKAARRSANFASLLAMG